MDDGRSRDQGPLALAVGVVAACSAASLATFFVVGGPFGTLNDVGNAATGVLSAALAWRLRRDIREPARGIALGAAVAGAALTVLGSALVVSGTTGFFLASLVSSVGFAAIGAWLVLLNRSEREAGAGPGHLRSAGLLAGGLMMAGIVMAPGIALGLDDMAAAPGWIWIGFLGWLGTFVAYPVWAIATGVHEARQGRRVETASGAFDSAV